MGSSSPTPYEDKSAAATARFLAASEVFRVASQHALQRLAAAGVQRTLGPGEQLIRQGEPGSSVFLIVSGCVRVERVHPGLALPLVLAELAAGEVVGEMSVLNQAPRSASVRALEPTVVVEFEGAAIEDLLVDSPHVSRSLLLTFSRRLRRADLLAERVLDRTNG